VREAPGERIFGILTQPPWPCVNRPATAGQRESRCWAPRPKAIKLAPVESWLFQAAADLRTPAVVLGTVRPAPRMVRPVMELFGPVRPTATWP